MGMPFFVTVHSLRPRTVTHINSCLSSILQKHTGMHGAMPPLAIDFQNERIENKPPVLHRGKLTFNLATSTDHTVSPRFHTSSLPTSLVTNSVERDRYRPLFGVIFDNHAISFATLVLHRACVRENLLALPVGERIRKRSSP